MMKHYLLFTLIICLGLLACTEQQTAPNKMLVPVEGLKASGKSVDYFVPPPVSLQNGRSPESVPFTVTFNPQSCGMAVTTWPDEARTAVAYAASIWGALLTARVPIAVNACWATNLASDTLANGKPVTYYRDFANAPQSGIFYPVALANDFAVRDLNGGDAEISMNFNAATAWYLPIDGDTPANRYDLVTVALHEMGHGLGFLGSMEHSCGETGCLGSWGLDPGDGIRYSIRYDQFGETGQGLNLLTDFTNGSVILGNELTSEDLFFGGANAEGANGGTRPPLYAPKDWDPGSSFSHLDQATFEKTPNALMAPALDAGTAIHHPGAVGVGVMRDVGWLIRNYDETYVRSTNNGYEDGSAFNPFNSVTEGMNTVEAGGKLWIWSGRYNERVVLRRPMTIDKWNNDGVVVIGEP